MSVHERPVSERVVEALSTHAGVDPLDLDPLYEVVDPDALDAIFQTTTDGSPASPAVRFRYGGYTVTVRGDGDIQVSDATPNTVPLGE